MHAKDIVHVTRDDQRVARVLVEDLVGLGVKRVPLGIPDDLVDADDLPTGLTVMDGASKADQEDRVAGDGGDIDRAIEGN